MSKDNTAPALYAALGCLTIIVLVCLFLLASPSNEGKRYTTALEVAEQQYKRDISDLDRRHAMEIQRLQEQINTVEFVTRKRMNLIEDDLKSVKRELHDAQERLKARNQ